MAALNRFYKNKDTDVIRWVDDPEDIGTLEFSFDKITVYNLFQDYRKLPPDLMAIFNRENPEWAAFFGN